MVRNLSDHELKHHGVLGMKWGVRHDKKSVSSIKSPRKKSYKKTQLAIVVGSKIVKKMLKKYGSDKVATVGSAVVTVGSSTANIALSVKARRENKKNGAVNSKWS